MQPCNPVALKEWAVVCAALDAGVQAILLRKGGIYERTGGFEVEHGEFWLFPTQFHQSVGELLDEAAPLLAQVEAERPPEGTIRFRNYAVVTDVLYLDDERKLPAVACRQILSHATVGERFHYRRAGLFVLALRVYRLPEPIDLPDSPHFAGCRSWVELPDRLSTAGLEPVLDDVTFARQVKQLRQALAEDRPA